MKSKFILMFVVATILVATLVLIYDLYQASENEVTDRFREHQTMIVRHLAQEIEQCLQDRSRGVQVLSRFASIQHRDTEMMTADIQEYFKYLKKNHVKAISVYDAKGTIICSTTEEATGQNHSNTDFFQWATRKENKGKVFISSLMPARQMSAWRTEENRTDLPPNFRFLIPLPPKLSSSRLSFLPNTPGTRRETASTIIIAGISPPVNT